MKLRKIFIFILVTWSLGPLFIQLYTSFCPTETLINPFGNTIQNWTLSNYRDVLTASPPFYKYLTNSLIVGLSTTLLTLLLALPASYSISKLPHKLTTLTKLFLISAALFPYVLLFLSLLEIARNLNLGNNLLAITIPYSGLCLPLAILILSSAFNDIPNDLEDASRIEGLNMIQRLRWVLIPLISPATASTGILIFLFSWNEYPIALTWLSKTDLLTLPVAIGRIAGSSVYSVPYGAYAAATVIGSIPLFIIMIIFQKQIVSGLTQGAIKG